MRLRARQSVHRRWQQVCSATAALLAWLTIAPISFVVRRKPGLIVLIGRDGGRFLDNCKHFYIGLVRNKSLQANALYLADSRRTSDSIRGAGGKALRLRSLRGIWALLRAEVVCVDSTDWAEGLAFPATRGARRVQLWHGIPLKLVQQARLDSKSPAEQPRWPHRLYAHLTGRFVTFDWLVSTSQFVTDAAFSRAFRFQQVSHAGYPRNDALFSPPCDLSLIGVDERYAKSLSANDPVQNEFRYILYAPTFREASDLDFQNALECMEKHACENGYQVLVKLHPWVLPEAGLQESLHLVFLDPKSDVYPLLSKVGALVTDYSSIYFDFLLLDRPVIFYCPDLETYLARERGMFFDYESMTPGPKAKTSEELTRALHDVVERKDQFKDARTALARRCFEHPVPGASYRLASDILGSTRTLTSFD